MVRLLVSLLVLGARGFSESLASGAVVHLTALSPNRSDPVAVPFLGRRYLCGPVLQRWTCACHGCWSDALRIGLQSHFRVLVTARGAGASMGCLRVWA